jgi:hypothetical protein
VRISVSVWLKSASGRSESLHGRTKSEVKGRPVAVYEIISNLTLLLSKEAFEPRPQDRGINPSTKIAIIYRWR